MSSLMDSAILQSSSAIVLTWIGQAVIYGSVLALLTWVLIKSVFRKASPTIHGLLWLVVLLKFILPVGPSWDYSLGNLIGDIRSPWTAAATPPVTQLKCEAQTGASSGDILLIPVTCEVAPPPPKLVATSSPWWAIGLTLLAASYLLAVLIVAAWRLKTYWAFARRCAHLPHASTDSRSIVAAVCTRLGVKTLPSVRISDETGSPFVFGLIKPTLVIANWLDIQPNEPAKRPGGADECVDRGARTPESLLEAVVLHEIAHLRRWDLLVRYVQWIAGTLLFFWPVVAWVNRRVDLIREQACDEWALRYSQLSPGDYARTLLRAAQSARSRRLAYAPSAMAANVDHVERRIEMILDAKSLNRRRAFALPAIAIVGVWSALVLSSAKVADEPTGDSEDQTQALMSLWDIPDWLTSAYQAQVQPPRNFECQVQFVVGDGAECTTGDVLAHQLQFVIDDEAQVATGFDIGEFTEIMIDGDEPFEFQTSDGLSDVVMHRVEVSGPSDGAPGIFVLKGDSSEGDAGEFTISCTPTAAQGVEMQVQTMACTTATTAGEPQFIVMQGCNLGGDSELPKFLADHPAADANSDGTLTWDEHAAYVVAVAMSDAKSVLGQFPKSDRDANGKLDAIEAARLVQGGNIVDEVHAGAFSPGMKLDASCQAAPLAERKIKVVVNGKEMEGAEAGAWVAAHHADVAATPDARGDVRQRVIVRRADTAGEPTIHTTAVPMISRLPEPAQVWILANINADVTASDVAKYIPAVEQAPLATFLELNPTADANHDGKLTADERDAFVEKQTSSMRARLLEKYPEADTNGDGLLTTEEMGAFWKSRAPKGNTMKWEGSTNGSTPGRRVMIKRTVQSAGAESPQVEVSVESDTQK